VRVDEQETVQLQVPHIDALPLAMAEVQFVSLFRRLNVQFLQRPGCRDFVLLT